MTYATRAGKCEVPWVVNGTLEPGFSTGTYVNHGNVLRYRCRDGFANDTLWPECNNGTWTTMPQCIPGQSNYVDKSRVTRQYIRPMIHAISKQVELASFYTAAVGLRSNF